MASLTASQQIQQERKRRDRLIAERAEARAEVPGLAQLDAQVIDFERKIQDLVDKRQAAVDAIVDLEKGSTVLEFYDSRLVSTNSWLKHFDSEADSESAD